MTKKNLPLFAAVLILAVAVTILIRKNEQAASDLLPVDVHTLRFSNGWGYDIIIGNKIYIHQDCIPAVASYKRFVSEEQALATGKLVVAKMRQAHKPVVTIHDLDSLHITY